MRILIITITITVKIVIPAPFTHPVLNPLLNTYINEIKARTSPIPFTKRRFPTINDDIIAVEI